MTKRKFKLVTEYPVQDYRCGLRAGDRVRLKHDIIVRDHLGKPTGVIHRAGEIWVVLSGAAEDPAIVWLRQPDGKRHTWDDAPSIFNIFEILS